MTEEKLKSLLAQLSLDEEIGQTNMLGGSIYSDFSPAQQDCLLKQGAIGCMMYLDPHTNNLLQQRQLASSSHALPILFCGDIIHGIRTIFPCPLAEAATFDPSMAEEAARLAAKEGSALGGRWTFAPMADLARDARWGRNIEGAGEDPYLAGEFTAARVRGFQSPRSDGTIDENHLAATIKHFAGYSFMESGLEYQRSIVSDYELETYAYPVYRAGVKAGANSVMASFNDIGGVPCTANSDLLNKCLRKQWGFRGVVVSDYGAVRQLVNSHYAPNEKEAVYEAFTSGCDIDMESRLYLRYLKELIQEGRLSKTELDQSVLRILSLKNKVGLLEHPFVDESRQSKDLLTPEALAWAELEAIRSAVLLKNDGVLPLKAEEPLGVMGPFYDNAKAQNGPWSYDNTLRESLTYKVALEQSFTQLREGSAPRVLFFAGLEREEGGEAASKSDLDLPLEQKEKIRALVGAGCQVILIVTSSRVLSLTEEEKTCSAILYLWAPGIRGGSALAKLLLGIEEPTGHLPMSFPRRASQCPIYYNGFTSPRPYNINDYYTSRWHDLPLEPLYPFGYGLSYYPWTLKNLSADQETYQPKEKILLSFDMVNLSSHPIRRLAQIYAHKAFHQPMWPEKELIAFHWENLGPNERKRVSVSLPCSSLSKGKNNPGEYTLMLALDSATIMSEVKIQLG